jgi:hypothetical protein
MKISAFIQRLPAILKKPLTSEKWQRFGFALFSTLLIMFFVKIPIEPFKLEIHDAFIIHSSEWSTYMAADIDNDGNSERIYLYTALESNRFTIIVHDNKGMIIETIGYINHDWTSGLVPAIMDINGDNLQEILFVALKNDSVVLNGLTLSNGVKIIDNLLIGIVENPVDQMACASRIHAFGDYDNDGRKELYFTFDAGFGLKPRGLYRLDVDSLKLYRTPESYISWTNMIYKDINKDGIIEILPGNYAPMNVHFETDYSDNNAWIAAFDLDLNYLFPPIAMPTGYGSVEVCPATFSDTLFFALYSNNSANANSAQILLVDFRGNILRKQTFFRDDPASYWQTLLIEDNKNYLYINNIGRFELTAQLDGLPQKRLKKQRDYKPQYPLRTWQVDADHDGIEDRIFYDITSSSFEITNGKSKKQSTIQLPFERLWVTFVYPYFVNGRTDRLMVATNSGYFFLSYAKNPYYWSKYLIWFAIFFTAYIIIFLIQYLQRRRMEQKWETEKQLTELQFNTIRNQLNPHFVFNALSSVGYLIESGKKEEAYDFLSVNTRLIRKVLDDAELTSRSLAAEINFVKDYLSIQEFRFKDRFRTTYCIDESVNLQLAVPKMVLHTYIENAVKHGFKNINSGGILEIIIDALPKGVIFTVRDNGHSEDLPVESPENTGKGIKIMESYYRLFEKQHKCKIHTVFTKISDINPEETGTEVIIRIENL